MASHKRAFWRFRLFQVPCVALILSSIFLFLAFQLNLGAPQVAVVVALDISGSTQSAGQFNAPNSIMAQSVDAVNAYVDASSVLKQPNHIKVIAMGGGKAPELTKDFQSDFESVKSELKKSIQDPKLLELIKPEPSQDDLNIVFQKANESLSTMSNMCRELVVVSDNGVNLSETSITEAIANKIRVSSIIFGGKDVDMLQQAASLTKGLYLSGSSGDFKQFFIDRFFPKFNSNLRWVIFWLGMSWMALMWVLVLPLDIFLQKVVKLPLHWAGKLSLNHALFWTALTPFMIWKLAEGLPFINACS
jgi:Ca-activated chloride channel homolog